jgi:ribose transport system permease protein
VVDIQQTRGRERFADGLSRASRTAFGTTETLYVAVLMVVLFATFASLNSGFYSGSNLSTIAQTAAYTGIIGVGMTFVLVTGEIDLSVGSMAGLGAISAATVMQQTGSVALGVVAGILTGAIIGAINGVLVVFVGLPSFIVTLGMLFAARGLAYAFSGAKQVYPLPAGVSELSASFFGIPVSVLILVITVVIGDWVLRRSGYGRRVYAIGGNSRAAILGGIRPTVVRLIAFIFTAVLASIAGILQMSLLKSGDPQIGTGLEFSVIAAVVVGGVGLTGGRGTVLGGVLGVVFVQVVSTGLVVSGMDSSLQPAVLGVIMIAALSLKRFIRQ